MRYFLRTNDARATIIGPDGTDAGYGLDGEVGLVVTDAQGVDDVLVLYTDSYDELEAVLEAALAQVQAAKSAALDKRAQAVYDAVLTAASEAKEAQS